MTEEIPIKTTQQPATPYMAFNANGDPFLRGSRCKQCAEVYLGERANCAKCTTRGQMEAVELSTEGRLYNFTIVYRSYPGVKVPFVSAIVDLENGGTVKGNLIDIDPVLENIHFDMPVSVVFRGAEIANAAGAGFLSHFFVPKKD